MISRAFRAVSVYLRVPSRGRWRTGPDVESNVRRVGRVLRLYGLGRGQTRDFLGELRTDLAEAAASGTSMESVLGADLKAFAGQVAAAHGRAPVPSRIALIVLAMGAPLLLIGAATYILIGGGENLGLDYYAVSISAHEQVSMGDGSTRTVEVEHEEEWLPLLVYGLAGFVGGATAFGLAGALLKLVGDRRVGETLRRLLAVLPAAGIAGVGGAMLLGNATNYSTTQDVIVAEALIVALAVIVGIAVAREWARRLPRPKPAQPAKLLGPVTHPEG